MAMSKNREEMNCETEVEPRTKRRVFSIQYKRRIVEQADSCTMPGEVGALLRKEGLYSSHLTDWRRELQRGNLEGYGRLRRGPIAKDPPLPPARDEQQRRIEQLERENQKLRLYADSTGDRACDGVRSDALLRGAGCTSGQLLSLADS